MLATPSAPAWHADKLYADLSGSLTSKITAGSLPSEDTRVPPVIRSATAVRAMTMGQQAQMGTVVPGKLANFVFLSKNPLEDIENVRSESGVNA